MKSRTNHGLLKLQKRSTDLVAKTAGLFENFFCCVSTHVEDESIPYPLSEILFEEEEEEVSCSIRPSCSVSTSEKAVASTDSVLSRKSGAGSIVFLDAMEPRVRPVLHLPASASIRTATTASMSGSSQNTIPTIQGSQTFDSECSLYSSATDATRPRSISSLTTAKCRTYSKKDTRNPDEEDHESIRRVQTEVLPYLPVLSATDGYRC